MDKELPDKLFISFNKMFTISCGEDISKEHDDVQMSQKKEENQLSEKEKEKKEEHQENGFVSCDIVGIVNYSRICHSITVVPATAGPLGERPPALVGHFCNVPTTVFAVLMSLYPAATCHAGPLLLRTGGGRIRGSCYMLICCIKWSN